MIRFTPNCAEDHRGPFGPVTSMRKSIKKAFTQGKRAKSSHAVFGLLLMVAFIGATILVLAPQADATDDENDVCPEFAIAVLSPRVMSDSVQVLRRVRARNPIAPSTLQKVKPPARATLEPRSSRLGVSIQLHSFCLLRC